MSSAKSSWSKWSPVSVAFLALAAFALPALGQEADKTSAPVRYVDDWSTHHVTFSNPGTREDAEKNGTIDKWLKITSDPRYQMQLAKRKMGTRPVVADPNLTTADPKLATETVDAVVGGPARPVDPTRPQPFSMSPIKKDWSMSVGAQTGASLTLTVNCTTNCSGGVSSSSQISIAGPTGFATQTLQGSAPTPAISTGTFSARASTGADLVITNGTNTLTLTAGTTNGTCSGSTPWSVSFNRGTSGTSSTYSSGIIAVLGSGTACSTDIGVVASGTSPALTLTAVTAGTSGNSITLTWGGTPNFTPAWSSTDLGSGTGGTAGTWGANSATTFKYTASTGVADTGDQLAADLVAAIGMNTTVTGAMTVAQGAGGNSQVIFTTTTPAATGYSVSDATFSAVSGIGDLTGGAASTVNPNTYPAKYSTQGTSGASCSDYVVYPTGFTGSATQASIIGYTDIYGTSSTGCGSTDGGVVPKVAFAYDTAGTSGLSPLISLDGSQIAYIQTNSSGQAQLVIMKPSLTSGGTIGSPATITGPVSLSSYRACTAPCYTTITFGNDANDTNSSPFYDYPEPQDTLGDTLWVGDNIGYLHQFTGVFNGTPAETTTHWPVDVVSGDTAATGQTTPAPLAAPVFDNVSKYIFVTDGDGYLHSISTATTPVVETSSQMECGIYGFVDSPILDSTYEDVYIFSGDGCNATPGQSYINRFTVASLEATGSGYGAIAAGFGNAGTNDTSTVAYAGSFDNAFYVGSSITTGNMYACVNGQLFQVPMSKLGTTTSFNLTAAYDTAVSAASDAAACSPVTEFYDGTHDWLFTSVAANGSATGCTGACLYNFNVEAGAASGTPTAGQSVAGGAGGVIIDNLSTTQVGAEQIYYSSQSNQTCTGTTVTGSGTGTCAVQAAQAAP